MLTSPRLVTLVKRATMYHVVMGVVVVMATATLRDVTAGGRCPTRCFCQRLKGTVYCARRGYLLPSDVTQRRRRHGSHEEMLNC